MEKIRIPQLIIALFLLLIYPCLVNAGTPGHTINTDMAQSKYQPVVTADRSTYNEESGLYNLSGNVRIQCEGRLITANNAKINANTLQVWADGRAAITEGEMVFTRDALYAELSGNTVWFFGNRCGVERPGLMIHGDNMQYNWKTHIVIFDGHVLWVHKGKSNTTTHLEFDLEKDDVAR